MTLATILIGLWMLLVAARGTPIGDWLESLLVVRPAAALARIRRQTILAATTLGLIALLCWGVVGHEGVLMFSMGMPELGAALAAIDLTALFDVAVVLVATASAGHWRAIRTIAARRRAPARSTRARRTRVARKPAANDDGEGARPALAA